MTRRGRAPAGDGYILVVDDDPDVREVMQMALESRDYRVETAADGRAALAIINEPLPCLVLLDLMMPVMSGAEFLAELRADPHLQALAVVIVSAWPQEAAKIAGAQGFVGKPVDMSQLLELVERYC